MTSGGRLRPTIQFAPVVTQDLAQGLDDLELAPTYDPIRPRRDLSFQRAEDPGSYGPNCERWRQGLRPSTVSAWKDLEAVP